MPDSDPAEPLLKLPVLSAQITREEAMVIYEDMYLGRAFEDMCAQMCVHL